MRWLTIALLCLLAGSAAAETDQYLAVSLGDLEGVPEALDIREHAPRAALAGPGEAYLSTAGQHHWGPLPSADVHLVVRAPRGRAPSGLLVLPTPKGFERVPFDLTGVASHPDAQAGFREVKAAFYRGLLGRRIAGVGWFRHRIMEASGELNDRDLLEQPGRTRGLERSFDFFSGGRAVSENLQLTRGMPGGAPGEKTVAIDSLKGITVQEMDWTSYLKDAETVPDRLAGHVPVDQFALFFPTFQAMLDLIDAADESGTPLLHSFETQAVDARTRERYETQLGLGTDFLSRQLGPHMIRSVVMTASDPFLRAGTDVAVLFEPVETGGFAQVMHARRRAKARGQAGLEEVGGEIDGIVYDGLVTSARVVSSYQATIGGAVVVTNSLVQLRKIAAAAREGGTNLGALDEYKFFRHRYQAGAAGESGLLVIPDAAIRKWCGPRWRIAMSRRVRAAAVLAGLEAEHIGRLVAGGEGPAPLSSPWSLVDAGKLEMGPHGVTSSLYNTRRFLTPIAEMELTNATEQEAEFYNRWRRGYERNWSNYFDPVAARFTVDGGRLAVDLTVMPLIVRSDYRQWLDIVKGARIKAGSGDPHDSTLVHFAMAINKDNPVVKMGTGFLQMMGAKVGAHPLAWLGESVSIYLDRDAVFDEALRDEDPEQFMEQNFWRMPIVLQAEVASPMKATMFLAAMRAWIEQTAPGMTAWSNHEHGEQTYVRVSPSAKVREEQREMAQLSVYYAVQSDRLVVTMNEDVLKRSLDRRAARAEKKTPARPWPGDHLNLTADRDLLTIFDRILGSENFRGVMRDRSWGNLPILNEWKRLYPDRDPVALHEQVFGTRLVCPGGGRYAWNDEWKTMESTAFGHPAAPKEGPEDVLPFRGFESGSFGLTFEDDGLRAVCELKRAG